MHRSAVWPEMTISLHDLVFLSFSKHTVVVDYDDLLKREVDRSIRVDYVIDVLSCAPADITHDECLCTQP